jgi:hypothetical protein
MNQGIAATSAPTQILAPDLTPDYDLRMTVVNERVIIRDDPVANWRVVLVHGVVFGCYSRGDAASERHVCVRLRLSGLAMQAEIAEAFGHVRATQCRWEKAFRDEGLSGLFTEPPLGRRSSMPKDIEDAAVALHVEGLGMRRIAARLGITLHQVAGVYKRRSLSPQVPPKQEELFAGQEPEENIEIVDESEVVDDDAEFDDVHSKTEPWDGLLVPQYEPGAGVPWAGVLLALPVLRRHRVLEVLSEIYASLGLLAFYGLQTMVTLMVYLALWRVKRPEHLKGLPPWDLGRVLGLPRVPEVKTVRRKLARMAAQDQARAVMIALAEERIRQEEDLLGYLYVDGHVREYSGHHDLGHTYKMQRHTPVRATTDTWANDRNGDPVFLVTSEFNEGLTATLKTVLAQARELVGAGRRITVVFDRGGFSPQLFVDLIRGGYDLITYRKGKTKDLDLASFAKQTFTAEGREVSYWLCDQAEVRVGKDNLVWGEEEDQRPLFMRQVTRLTPDTGHQTKVLTTRADLKPEEVLWRMFARWRQENFFKYMKEEFAVDGLVEYGALPVDPKHERPNPAHLALSNEIRDLKAHILRLEGERCQLIGRPEARQDAPPGFERFVPGERQARQLCGKIQEAHQQLAELQTQRDELPERVSAGDLKRLRTERQQLATVFKIAAYRIETELVRLVADHYARTEDEGRKLIAAALRSPADIEVKNRELRVTLAPQSSPHRSRAIAALCASLNKLDTVVPGTRLRLVLACAVEPPDDVSC